MSDLDPRNYVVNGEDYEDVCLEKARLATEVERLRGALSEIAALYQPSMQSPTSADASRSRILILRAREIAYAALEAL